MTRSTTRTLRGGLLALVLVVLVSVAWTIRRPATTASPSPAEPRPAVKPSLKPSTTRTEELVYRSLKGDRESFVLKAQKMAGQEQEELRLKVVDLTFGFISQGKPSRTHVTSDECIYTPTQQKALFQGHVHLTTEDGFELTTESLLYRGDKGVAKSTYPVEFKRKAFSGTSTGMSYHSEGGRLELPADAYLRIEDSKKGPPTEIRGNSATFLREERSVNVEGAAEVTQGADRLKADRIQLDFYPTEHTISQLQAWTDVELKLSGQSAAATTWERSSGLKVPHAAAGGPRELRCQKLDMSFRPDRSIEEVAARPDAELVLMPGRGQPREKRILRASVLVFRLDAQNRVEEVQGQKDSTLVVEPIPPAQGLRRTVKSHGFLARLDPATGEARTIDFSHDVEFTRGSEKGTGDKGFYEGAKSLLGLRGDPHLVNEGDGSDLTALAIDVQTLTGDVAARHAVHHTLKGKRAPGRSGFLSSSDAPTVVTSRLFDYETKSRTGRYQDGALLRSGQDEVRASEIQLQEDAQGRRRLTASGGVVSILHERADTAGKPPPAPMEGRSKSMVYDESKNVIVYTGDAILRQEDIVTHSPEATVTLTADGSAVEKMVAGTPVEVQQGTRKGNGSVATYTPADQLMLLVGDRVVLKDPTQEVEGRSLTFHVHDDRILVDGREEVRTQTIFRKEPPKP